jgi:heme-degrading monooxygenase HmoA
MGIMRSWQARASKVGADAYVAFFRERLAPELARIPGYRGALVLRRTEPDAVQITVQTFWESMDAVGRFAGANPSRAVVAGEARAALLSFDDTVRHDEVALDSRR